MEILALEPFHGGSHQAFLDGWRRHSKHRMTILRLPAYKWKWRMRHAAVTFASQLHESSLRDQRWDAVWCSDMLNLAEFLGLAPPAVASLPRIVYFHENQLTYPVRHQSTRDLHFAFTNFTTALAADEVWFNSTFHHRDFLTALRHQLRRMPDFVPLREIALLEQKTDVQYPGIDPLGLAPTVEGSTLTIGWNARWEFDKNPDDFFEALRRLKQMEFPFRLVVLGESFRHSPPIFQQAREEFRDQILHWGFAESREAYRALLQQVDVIVSTADHEFFGISVLEAISGGAKPILPERLAYPEILSELGLNRTDYLYDGSVAGLVHRLVGCRPLGRTERASGEPRRLAAAAKRFAWQRRGPELDRAIARVVDRSNSSSAGPVE